MISIALVDDHLIFLDALEKYLEKVNDYTIVFKGSSSEEFLNYLESGNIRNVDIVLLDIKMKGMSGIDCLQILTEKYTNVKVIMLSMFDDISFVRRAINYGAMSFIPKDIDSEILIHAINSVYENGFYAHKELSELLASNIEIQQGQDSILPKSKISKSELEVLKLLCQGYTAAEIGKKIYRSKRTIEGHKQRMLDKTNQKNTTSLVAWALRNGVVD